MWSSDADGSLVSADANSSACYTNLLPYGVTFTFPFGYYEDREDGGR